MTQQAEWRKAHPEENREHQRRYYGSGVSPLGKRPWTQAEEAVILKRETDDRTLSFRLNRTIRAIQIRRSRLR